MVGPCRSEGARLKAVFNTAIWKVYSSVSMLIYRDWCVYVMYRSYTVLQDFTDPSAPDLFRELILPFRVSNEADVKGTTKLAIFLKRKKLLEASGSDWFDWKIVLNHDVAEQSKLERRKGLVLFFNLQLYSMVTIIKSYLGILLHFSWTFIWDLCLHFLVKVRWRKNFSPSPYPLSAFWWMESTYHPNVVILTSAIPKTLDRVSLSLSLELRIRIWALRTVLIGF